MNIEIKNVNKLPMPTWRWLKLNDTTISFKDINKLDNIKPTILNLNENVILKHDKIETFPNFNTGMGKEVATFVEENSSQKNFITIKENTLIDKEIIFKYDLADNTSLIEDNYIHVKQNSKVTLVFVYNSLYPASGIYGNCTKIYLEENAQLEFIQLQTLGRNYHNFNDIGVISQKNSTIKIKQFALGAKDNYLGSNIDLVADNVQAYQKINYITGKNQFIDMNYIATISGKKTDTAILANGILMDNAKKVLRGTLDFKQGCKGSVGNENEEVLLLDEDVHNKSIPLILCNEDDIEGNHSASIGEMDNQQLFYLQTRGLNRTKIRQLQIDSKIQLICNELSCGLDEYVLDYAKEAFKYE